MHDVITIGSATVDILMKSSQFHLQSAQEGLLLCEAYGGKIDIEEFEIHSGGASTNTAVGFRRMGFHTASVAEVGKDFLGQIIWDELKREQVDTDFIITEKSEQTAVSVLLISRDGGRSALTHRGAASMLEARDMPWQALTETRWIHLSNVSGNKELLLRLFDHLKTSLVGLSWNPGSHELELLAKEELKIEHIQCDVFVVNKEEWAVVKNIQQSIQRHIPYVIVTDGARGGEVYLKGSYQFTYEPHQVKVMQETGAGDSFIVGFVSAHLLGKDLVECVEWGKRNAASVVQQMGAKKGLLRRKDLGI